MGLTYIAVNNNFQFWASIKDKKSGYSLSVIKVILRICFPFVKLSSRHLAGTEVLRLICWVNVSPRKRLDSSWDFGRWLMIRLVKSPSACGRKVPRLPLVFHGVGTANAR